MLVATDSSQKFVVDEVVFGEGAAATPRVGPIAAQPFEHPLGVGVVTCEVIRFNDVGYLLLVAVDPLPTDAIVTHGVDEPER